MIGKKQGQLLHCKVRAQERYNLEINRELVNRIVNMIQQNKTTPVKKLTCRLTEHTVKLDSYPELRVVYDRNRKSIATFLPPLTSNKV